MMNDWLSQRARSSPEKTALIFEDQTWSFAALNLQAENFARQLRTVGIHPGEHVAVLAANSPEYVIAIHALIKLGVVLVALNTRLTLDELNWQIQQSDAVVLLHGENYGALAQKLHPQSFSLTHLAVSPQAAEVNLPGAFALDNPQAIIFTSGTTGEPKGALLTLANHFWSATASAFRLGLAPDDRWLLCLPLYHVGGMAIILRSCLYGTGVVLHDDFSPQQIAASIRQDAVTMISLVPTMLQRLMAADLAALKLLRVILLGGGAASVQLLQQSQAAGLPLVSTYGLTEACSQVATSTLEKSIQKTGSVGKPLIFTQVDIESPDGEILAPGEIGKIVVAGPTVMPGYYRRPEATDAVLRNGCLHTGDIGYLDADGDLWVVQRRTDLIVSGGENVYPSEVENVLVQHASIKEACVIGLEHSLWGQQVAAAIILHEGQNLSSDDVQQYCRASLAGYKIPRVIRFVDEFARTASGKIIRNRVRVIFEKA